MADFYTKVTVLGEQRMTTATAGAPLVLNSFAVGFDPADTQYATNAGFPTSFAAFEKFTGPINSDLIPAANPNWRKLELVLPPTAGGWNINRVAIFNDANEIIYFGAIPETEIPAPGTGSSRVISMDAIIALVDGTDPGVVSVTVVQNGVHDHDADYSAIGHDHDADYSATGHDHDADYSAIGHKHNSQILYTGPSATGTFIWDADLQLNDSIDNYNTITLSIKIKNNYLDDLRQLITIPVIFLDDNDNNDLASSLQSYQAISGSPDSHPESYEEIQSAGYFNKTKYYLKKIDATTLKIKWHEQGDDIEVMRIYGH